MPREPTAFREFESIGGEHRTMVEGLLEIDLGPRVALDLLVTVDHDLIVFLCVDGEVLVELPTAGEA
jgi:hypothetical protein